MTYTRTYTEFTPRQVASVAHEAVRQLQRILDEQVNFQWESCSPDLQNSAISGVEKILSGEIKRPEDSHESWMRYKASEGWKYGPVKDFAKKEHPDMVPFDQLPSEQQAKDRLFFAIVLVLGTDLAT